LRSSTIQEGSFAETDSTLSVLMFASVADMIIT
jgi:hypothetical protein